MNDYVETPPPERAAPVALPEPPPATSSSHAGSPQRQRSNSLYDLFLTAVGLTPRGVETSPPGSQPAEDEEEFWSAVDDNDVREFGGATTSSASNTPSERQMTPRQPAGHSQREIAQTAMTTGPGGDGGDASRPLSTSRARLAAEYPASGSDGLDGPDNQTEDGLPRRRRRWFRVQVVSADTSGNFVRWCEHDLNDFRCLFPGRWAAAGKRLVQWCRFLNSGNNGFLPVGGCSLWMLVS